MPDWQETDQRVLDEDHQYDLLLIQKIQDGDTDAFGDLYERYYTPVFRFVCSRLGSQLDAEDLVAEIFVRVWRSLPGYKQQGAPFVAYLFRIARNALIDHFRRNRHYKNETSLEDTIASDGRPGPADMVLVSLQNEEVRQVLESLRDDYRTVLELRFFAELSPEEAAEVMKKSPGAVRVLQHRALVALRKQLDHKRP